MQNKANSVELTGVVGDCVLKGAPHAKRCYYCFLKVERRSKVNDNIIVLIDRDNTKGGGEVVELGSTVRVSGKVQTEWRTLSGKVLVYVLAEEIEPINKNIVKDKESNKNIVRLKGNIVRKSETRQTPAGKLITDVLISVPCVSIRGEECRIPCVAWEKEARKMQTKRIGEEVVIEGRMQSRVYQKRYNDGTVMAKECHELSIEHME